MFDTDLYSMPAVRRLVDEDKETELRVSATEMDKMLAASKVRRISGLLKDLPQDISMRDIRKMRLVVNPTQE
jgi:hypothetical protein